MLDTFFSPLNSVQVSLNFTVSFFFTEFSASFSQFWAWTSNPAYLAVFQVDCHMCGGHRSR